jgi:N-acetylmuramic acid 6-phosphate etherase
MASKSITEEDSLYDGLEQMEVSEILRSINTEDRKVAEAVGLALPQIELLVAHLVSVFQRGGRLFYLGAGTSGRLGVVDASECVVTFGIPEGMITAIIAGGDKAIRTAVEGAEDDLSQGFKDIEMHHPGKDDMVIGITASGRTPYVINALQRCRELGITTGCIVCNPGSAASLYADFPVAVPVGPEFVTGSTRMKAGTAQKMVLNMISTAALIRLGRVEGNKMTHMHVSNSKLADRGIRIIMEKTGLGAPESRLLLERSGNDISKALLEFRK